MLLYAKAKWYVLVSQNPRNTSKRALNLRPAWAAHRDFGLKNIEYKF